MLNYKILKNSDDINNLDGITLFIAMSGRQDDELKGIAINLPAEHLTLNAFFILLKDIWKSDKFLIMNYQLPVLAFGMYELDIVNDWDITEKSIQYLHGGKIEVEKTSTKYTDLSISYQMSKVV